MTEYLTPRQTGIIRNKSENAQAQERLRNKGPRWVKDGGRILYPATDLIEYLRSLPSGGGTPGVGSTPAAERPHG